MEIDIHKTIIFVFFMLISGMGKTQTCDSLAYTNHNYNQNIKSVELYVAGDALSDAVINLNTEEKLYCSFDELYAGTKTYYYTITYCTSNWKKSKVWVNEYLQGIEKQTIYNVNSSFNTRTRYTNYNFTFPNKSLSLLKSGNYILNVFYETPNGESVTVFARRFFVVDQKVLIGANITRANTANSFENKQEVKFKINMQNYSIIAPTTDLKAVVLQNGRWDNALLKLKPISYTPTVVDYGVLDESNFMDAGNEFRNFDIKTLQTTYGFVRNITLGDTLYHVSLHDTESRKRKPYMSEEDINGGFLLKADDKETVKTNGEYAQVSFFLSTPPVLDGEVYVSGNFNAWQNTAENKMTYNFERKGYEASILFKQGYYNYIYMIQRPHTPAGDVGTMEGNQAQTKNKYTILLYHHPRGKQYDELIGYGNFESR